MGERSRLFVYGSLRAGAGHPMHAVLAKAGTFVGRGRVRGHLLRIDWYPGLVRLDDVDDTVVGDLWSLDDPTALRELDAYEGCGPDAEPPHEFERRSTTVVLDDGRTLPAWVYVYAGPVPARLPRIPSGDWLCADRH